MNEYGEEEERRRCFYHPRELVIGVCALCLKERLFLLASKRPQTISKLHNIFALIDPDIRHCKSHDQLYCDDSNSSKDSFISIKFEDNGVASWDKAKISTTTNDPQISHQNDQNILDKANMTKSVVEHAKPRSALRWRKRISHLLRLIMWKRSVGKGNMCHAGTKLDGAKAKRGWIRILTTRRTKE